MSAKKIHHINFLVKDLDLAIQRFSRLLGVEEFIRDQLESRGAKTAHVALGEQWFVLVQPTDPYGIPGKHLAEHGEGFFLISFAVDQMEKSVQDIQDAGFSVNSNKNRKGLENWWVRDINVAKTFGAQIQFCEEHD